MSSFWSEYMQVCVQVCVCVCRPRGSILGLIKSIHLCMMVPSSWMKYIYNFSENANPYFEVKMSQ